MAENAFTHTSPRHTPYDGSGKLFQIGLSLLGPEEWLEVDHRLGDELCEKARLLAAHRDQVWREIDGSRPVQAEVLSMVLADLAAHHVETHRLSEDGRRVEAGGLRFDLDDDAPPLLKAARMVQDDLLVLERRDAGWTLTAASLSFPSSWSLPDKIGRPMGLIHAPVPGFQGGSRNDGMIARIFDNLPVDAPVKRMNWSVNNTPSLYLPGHTAGKDPDLDLDHVHIRVERQTLRKLPETGALCFGIRIHVDSLADIMAAPRAAEFAPAFAAQIRALTPEQAGYKGFLSRQAALADRIEALAAAK